MTDVEDRKKEDPTIRTRSLYHRPNLRVYGRLRDLTAGGSEKANEGQKGNAKNRP